MLNLNFQIMFNGQPKGLYVLALANTGERFGYYTMLAIFTLFLQASFGFSFKITSQLFAGFLALVYFLPLFGGILADKAGYGKMVTIGIVVMFLGYLALAIPMGTGSTAVAAMIGSLVLIAMGTGLFKGNLQVLIGNLYDDPKYSAKRDTAFSIFYMAINIGALFAPTAATAITNWFLAKSGLTYVAEIPALAHQFLDGTISAEGSATFATLAQAQGFAVDQLQQFATTYIDKLSIAYHYGFGVACVSLIFSMLIYYLFRRTFKHADKTQKQVAAEHKENIVELTPQQTKQRITALMLVFAVVIFFWMAFHQNGLTLTWFARDYTAHAAEGVTRIGFDVWNLVLIIFVVFGIFSLFQSEKAKGKFISGIVVVLAIAGLILKYNLLGNTTINILPQIFQQFNPFFVIALTPVSLAIFGALAKKGKEPSAPRKIGIGMFIAAVGFLIMAVSSLGLPTPDALAKSGMEGSQLVSPNVLISTYLILTFAELCLSPMGISFVSKVAPPKYKGAMMGMWFVATAAGNYLVSVIGLLWGGMQLWMVWSVLIVLCLISAIFIFSIMRKLEQATA
jgi:proton-dependent oligopeptide transporter, POT family